MNQVIEILNDKQREAALTIDGPLLILAGAGSGKTRVLTNRAAYMISDCDVKPWNILAITFTNKAAGEMRERIDALVGEDAENIWVATFHATCVRILRRYIDKLGYDTNFTIYDTDDTVTVMKDVCKRLQIDTKQYSPKALLSTISKVKNEMMTPEDYLADAPWDYGRQQFCKTYAEYEKTLQKNNALDFDDLLLKTVALFQSQPEVLNYYQDKFLYIMVDEYQDTNTVQFELIRLLASKHRNICVVGDDDQSIYKFRGANIRNILDFEKVYPDAKVVKLEQNYRSTQTILDAANSVIKQNASRKDKALWTDKGAGNKVHFHQFDNAYEEAEFIANDIAGKRRRGDAHYQDCAVLYRTNAQSRLLEERMIMEGIPYDVVGGVNFYGRREIKDILAYLKTIDNARDDLAVRRIINVPKRGLGATTLARIQDYALSHELSFYDTLGIADQIPQVAKAAGKIKPFVEMIETYRSKLPYLTLEQLIGDILKRTEYIENMDVADDVELQTRVDNIDELINKVIAFQDEHEDATLSQFLEEVALVSDIDNVDADADRVMLMTLHSAKGLEFPQVYIAGMEDGLFPSYMNITSDDPSELEEERRLCYVGITRAKEDLTITCARSRMIRGETQYNAVSRFVKEIDPALLDGSVPKTRVRETDIPGPSMSTYGREMAKSKPYASSPAARNAYAKPYIATAAGAGKTTAKSNVLTKGTDILDQKAPLDYGVGDTVRHIKFGTGVVEQINDGGRDYEVSVNFEKYGMKKMFALFAKLQKV
ncbi:MAG: DNA helicase PcrA [Lachnospiraceae bacterium]|nr:DNA helicase PcrA [Lachnospiraceae bacterium]